MRAMLSLGSRLSSMMNQPGHFLGLLPLRLLLAWESGEAGVEKFTGENWFAKCLCLWSWPGPAT